jgi:hypothetical protein
MQGVGENKDLLERLGKGREWWPARQRSFGSVKRGFLSRLGHF